MRIRHGHTNIKHLKTKAIITLTMGMLAVPLTASAAPGVCTVGPSGASYTTIQAAVDDPACSTIKVAAGTYNESVTIGRSLTLQGAKAGKDARSRNTNNESVITETDPVNTPDITINADTVVVDGFTLNGPSSGGTAAFVMQNGNSGEAIKNNIVNDPGRAASITTSNSSFEENLVHTTATSVSGFQGNSTSVSSNVVNDNTFDGPAPGSYDADINFIEGSSNETITGNRSTDDATLVAIFKTNGATISDNTVVGNHGSSAIYIGGNDSNIKVTNNHVESAGSGVNVANNFGDGSNSNITISNNTLLNNTNAIKIGSGAIATDNTVAARHNALTGSTDHGFNNQSNFNALATCNWWGSKSGPGSVGSGTGNLVTTYVKFSPWLMSKDLNGDCDTPRASADLHMSNPSQRIVFNVVNRKGIHNSEGTIEYWNYDYPGGLHYKATVSCAYVNPQTGNARFMFQIPAGYPGLSGQYVVASVKAVKHGADQYAHTATSDASQATQWCENGVGYAPTSYTVTKGDVDIEKD